MAEQGTIRADQIEGLTDLIREQVRAVVREEAKPDLQDVEDVRRSPAGTVIRLEGKVDALDEKIDHLKSETNQRFDSLKSEMNQRFDSIEKRFTLLQWAVGLIYPILLTLLGKLFLMK